MEWKNLLARNNKNRQTSDELKEWQNLSTGNESTLFARPRTFVKSIFCEKNLNFSPKTINIALSTWNDITCQLGTGKLSMSITDKLGMTSTLQLGKTSIRKLGITKLVNYEWHSQVNLDWQNLSTGNDKHKSTYNYKTCLLGTTFIRPRTLLKTNVCEKMALFRHKNASIAILIYNDLFFN